MLSISLREYLDRPIPDLSTERIRRKGSRMHPIDLDSSQNAERAIDARLHGLRGENYYHRADNPPYWHCAPGAIPELYVREGILSRLLAANEIFRGMGFELFLYDAYRPVEVQNYFHDTWVPAYLRRKFPEWSDERVREETGNYWARGVSAADEIDPLSPPPHATGAVIDLTLFNMRLGGELFMGAHFDEVSEISHTDHFERLAMTRPLLMSEEIAQMNRRLLYWVMTEAGFTVNPNEWWHFGLGDQLSAKIAGLPHAVYSVLRI